MFTQLFTPKIGADKERQFLTEQIFTETSPASGELREAENICQNFKINFEITYFPVRYRRNYELSNDT